MNRILLILIYEAEADFYESASVFLNWAIIFTFALKNSRQIRPRAKKGKNLTEVCLKWGKIGGNCHTSGKFEVFFDRGPFD